MILVHIPFIEAGSEIQLHSPHSAKRGGFGLGNCQQDVAAAGPILEPASELQYPIAEMEATGGNYQER